MHRPTPNLSAKKARIHILERFEAPALMPRKGQKNAQPSPAAKRKSKTTTSKLSNLDKAPSSLERFAQEHDLVESLQETSSPFGEDAQAITWICFEDAYISDPLHDLFITDALGSEDAVERALKESHIENSLMLTLLEDQINRLMDRVGFDLPDFDIGENTSWPDPESSNWGAILNRIGLRYLTGCNTGMWLLFSSCDRASVAMALALARAQ